MQITRDNYTQYLKMVQQMLGNNKRLSNNPLSQCDYGNFSKRYTPVSGLKFSKPDWSELPTKTNAPTKSDAELEEEIRELARKDFASGKKDHEAFKSLATQYESVVSPDRKSIYEQTMRKTGGMMNAACMFYDSRGNKSFTYHPITGDWAVIGTEAEFARARAFSSIYTQEISRLQKEYGKEGSVTYQQIQNDMSKLSYSVIDYSI